MNVIGCFNFIYQTEAEVCNLAGGFSKASRLINTRTAEPSILETDRQRRDGLRSLSANASRAKEAKSSGAKKR